MAGPQLREFTDAEWAELEALSAEELLENIALARGRGALGHDLKEQGALIYRNAREFLAEKICTDSRVQAASRAANRGNSMALVASLADVVSGYLTGLAGASFCVLLLKDGLPEFCASYWKPPRAQQRR